MNTLMISILLLAACECSPRIKREYKYCKTDDDCDIGYHCYETGFCSECTVCSVYHREKGDQPCVTDPLNCGPCLEGYETEFFSNNRKKASCVRSSNVKPIASYSWTIIFLSLGCIVGIFLCIITLCCVKRLRSCFIKIVKQMILRRCSSLPPDNANCMYEYKEVSNRLSDEHHQTDSRPDFEQFKATAPEIPETIYKEDDHLLEARAFRRPDYQPPDPELQHAEGIRHEPFDNRARRNLSSPANPVTSDSIVSGHRQEEDSNTSPTANPVTSDSIESGHRQEEDSNTSPTGSQPIAQSIIQKVCAQPKIVAKFNFNFGNIISRGTFKSQEISVEHDSEGETNSFENTSIVYRN